MQRNNRLSTSAGASNRAWRMSSQEPRERAARPASDPGDPPALSDLGSDEEWHLTMGSDSDADPNADLNADDHVSLPGYKWNNEDEPTFVEDLPQSPLQPLPVPIPPPDPVPPAPVSAPSPTISPPIRDEYDEDLFDQPSIIPGYRGVASRTAIAETYPLPPFEPAEAPSPPTPARPPIWADRPRGNLHTTESTSRQSSPGRIARVPSDSALSSQGGSIGSGSALRISTRTSSETSDGSRRTASKSVSFVTQGLEAIPARRSDDGKSLTPDTPNSGLRVQERRISGLRMSIRDNKARLSTTRLSSSKRQARRATMLSQPSTNSRSSSDNAPERPIIIEQHMHPNNDSAAQAGSSTSMRPLSSKSEDIRARREGSALSQLSGRGERPFSTPLSSAYDSSGATDSVNDPSRSNTYSSFSSSVQTGAFTKRRPFVTPVRTVKHRHGSHSSQAPSTEGTSNLECVVQMLKGAAVLRRKNFVQASEAAIWLSSDLEAVKYRASKKGCAPVVHTLTLAKVRKLRWVEREILMDMMDEKKPINFIFPSRDRAEVWLAGLSCLVPSRAAVRTRHGKMENRENYDPLSDSWNGKQLDSRKRLNEFILLGSIGRGSFGKVKLALSTIDRQFYAVKVLSKAMMRKRSRTTQLERAVQETGNSTQLDVSGVNEIAAMNDLNHRNVMKMKGVYDDVEEDRLYIVIEFLARGPIMSSSKLTGAKPLPEGRARSAFIDVLAGLEYLHSKNIVHRDIKPDNLLESGDGTVKISDFGAARLYDDDEAGDNDDMRSHNTTVGTPAFTAPELCLSEKSPTCPPQCFAADIWSLGATLFYMVYGRAPFIARSVFEMYDAICSQPLVFPEGQPVSKELKEVIESMLCKLPEKRATFASLSQSAWLTESIEISDRLENFRQVLRGRTATAGAAAIDGRGKTGTTNRGRTDASGIRSIIGN